MAIPLPSFVLDASVASAGNVLLPTFVLDASVASAGNVLLPTFVLDASVASAGLVKLPTFQLTEDGPSSTTIVPTGGMLVGGAASIVMDPLIAVGSGGMLVGGTAPDILNKVRTYTEYPLGGMRLSGAAVDDVRWIEQRATGGMRVSGSAAIVLLQPMGPIAATLPKPTFASSGHDVLATVYATISARLPLPSFSAETVQSAMGTIDAVGLLPSFTSAGGLNELNATGLLPSFASSGLVGVIGSVAAQLPRSTFVSSGLVGVMGSVAAQLPLPQAYLSSTAGTLGTIAAQLTRPISSITALRGNAAVLAATLPEPTAALSGYMRVSGTVSATLPSITALLAGVITEQQVAALVMHTQTAALTQYAAYPYDSFCELAGKYLAAGPGGLYQIDTGATDNGTAIDASFSTGDLDFDNEYQKRVMDFFVGMRCDGDMALNIATDEGEAVAYTLPTYGMGALKQRRAVTAKGARGKYWRFELANTEGCDFEFDSINIHVAPLSRRL